MVTGPESPQSPSRQMEVKDLQQIKPVAKESRDPSSRTEEARLSRARETEKARGDGARGDAARGEQTADGMDREQMEEVKDKINEALAPINIALNYEMKDEIEKVVVEVRNRDTEELIRKIPPEEMLRMAKRMEEMVGVLVDDWR